MTNTDIEIPKPGQWFAAYIRGYGYPHRCNPMKCLDVETRSKHPSHTVVYTRHFRLECDTWYFKLIDRPGRRTRRLQEA